MLVRIRPIFRFCFVLGTFSAFALAGAASGQEDSPRNYFGGTGFLYFEDGEDEGNSTGGGFVFGRFFSPGFALEGEVAIPRFLGRPRAGHRDISISCFFGWRPNPRRTPEVVLLLGPSYLMIQERWSLEEGTTRKIGLGFGADLRFSMSEHFAFVPQVRGHLDFGAVVFRPGLSLQLTF